MVNRIYNYIFRNQASRSVPLRTTWGYISGDSKISLPIIIGIEMTVVIKKHNRSIPHAVISCLSPACRQTGQTGQTGDEARGEILL